MKIHANLYKGVTFFLKQKIHAKKGSTFWIHKVSNLFLMMGQSKVAHCPQKQIQIFEMHHN